MQSEDSSGKVLRMTEWKSAFEKRIAYYQSVQTFYLDDIILNLLKMYIEIFTDYLIKSENVVGIFDLDNTTTNKFTNDFLNQKQKEDKITYLVSDIPKSFILMNDGSVYIVELSSQILKKRFEII